jgi:predicted DsbA family dithiol-disulfide isomerase
MRENLQRHAAKEGLDFSGQAKKSLIFNTHRALLAGTYVQEEEPEKFEAFHHALFQATFTDGENLGDRGVISSAAATCGLDGDRMERAIDSGKYEAALQSAAAEARDRSITAVPAFLFGGTNVIVGAQPTEALARAFEQALADM